MLGATLSGTVSHALVASAYPKVNAFYMAKELRLAGAFVLDTPVYGLAARPGSQLPHRCRVITHPAPEPLIWQLLPRVLEVEEVVFATSTSAAAEAVRKKQVDIALTNRNAALRHGLQFISSTRPIRMLWSIFVRASAAEQEASHEGRRSPEALPAW